MSTNYPGSLDSLTNPSGGNFLDDGSVPHADQHANANDAIEALEAKLGTGASTPSSGTVLRGTGAGASSYGALQLASDVAAFSSADLRGRLSDETGTGAAVFADTPTILTPTIASFANANHDHTNSAGGGTLGANTVGNTQLVAGTPIQIVTADFTAVDTTTTLIPHDDTIPQNTEGKEFMSLAITPKSTTNILVIETDILLSSSVTNNLIAALFQDTGANALAATVTAQQVATGAASIHLTHALTSGTTSSTTFKVRGGASLAGTTTFNGSSAARLFGAITKSAMKVTEYKA